MSSSKRARVESISVEFDQDKSIMGQASSDTANSDEGPGMTEAFFQALESMADVPGHAAATKYVNDHRDELSKVLSLFTPDGRLRNGHLPASCYNDFYKFTMMPVIRAVEEARNESIRCTFSVNIRDAEYRRRLYESATGKGDPRLFEEVKQGLSSLSSRVFDVDVFEQCVEEYSLPGWDATVMDKVCGPKGQPRNLIQEFDADPACSTPKEPSQADHVLVQVFVARDEKLNEDRVYVEATGPWHKVTWLETSMMQAVYEALLRDRKRSEYNTVDDAEWYPKWMAETFCRCTRSVAAAAETGLKGALFTGRRTGGLALMMLQGLYVQHAFCDSAGKSLMLGTSSVTARYMSLKCGVPAKIVPACAGTHAHELSMVIGGVLGDVDDKVGMPLSQIIGHALYFYCSRPGGDVREAGRPALMPMLPDTVGSRAFLKTAKFCSLPHGPHEGNPILSVIGAARQDSGGLEDFKKLMDEFDYKGALMASEIEVPADLTTAKEVGFTLFGAGGYMGDSEKAWDQSKANISMAVKVLRVYVGGERSIHTPVKTGECSNEGKIKEGKFEADGTLSATELQQVRERAQVMATADPKVDAAVVQELFVKTLNEMLGPSRLK